MKLLTYVHGILYTHVFYLFNDILSTAYISSVVNEDSEWDMIWKEVVVADMFPGRTYVPTCF
jgi:hypothetical protein